MSLKATTTTYYSCDECDSQGSTERKGDLSPKVISGWLTTPDGNKHFCSRMCAAAWAIRSTEFLNNNGFRAYVRARRTEGDPKTLTIIDSGPLP